MTAQSSWRASIIPIITSKKITEYELDDYYNRSPCADGIIYDDDPHSAGEKSQIHMIGPRDDQEFLIADGQAPVFAGI